MIKLRQYPIALRAWPWGDIRPITQGLELLTAKADSLRYNLSSDELKSQQARSAIAKGSVLQAFAWWSVN